MRYLLAIILPPAAVLSSRRPRDLLMNVPLTALLWLPGVLHALLVVRGVAQRERTDRLAWAVLAREERLRKRLSHRSPPSVSHRV